MHTNKSFHLFVTHTEGFEVEVIEELNSSCADFFSQSSITHHDFGILAFTVPASSRDTLPNIVYRLCSIGSIDSVQAFIDKIENVPYDTELADDLLTHHCKQNEDQWNDALDLFEQLYDGKLKWLQQSGQQFSNEINMDRWWFNLVKFRVSAERYRVNSKHQFKSPKMCGDYGYGVHEKYGWLVNLKKYDINICLHLKDQTCVVGFQLTPPVYELASASAKSVDEEHFQQLASHCDIYKHVKRDYRDSFGRLNMKLSTAYCLLRTAKLHEKQNVRILDPMAGCGSIPLEAARWFNQNCDTYYCGDYESQEAVRAMNNVESILRLLPNKQLVIDVFNFDARNLPFRNQSIDLVVSDMPFGNQCGTHRRNVKYYPRIVKQIERVLKTGGTAVLLTTERKLLERVLNQRPNRWIIERKFEINMNNLFPMVYVCTRGPGRRITEA